MRKIILLVLLCLPFSLLASDYSTVESVRMVVTCMTGLGAQTEENLYTCACRHDKIAAQLSFKEYEIATTYKRYRDMPGERGGIFREGGDEMKNKLANAEKQAEQECPAVKRIERKVKQD